MNIDLKAFKKGVDSFLETKVSKLEAKHKLLICLASWLLPALAFFFLVFTPRQEEIHRLEGRRQDLVREIKKVEATARQLDKHKAEMKAVEIQFKAASMLLPEKKEIPSLLTNISSQGTNSGLEFISFKPKGEIRREFYAEIPVDIAVRGPYHNVGVFLDKISKLPRIVTVNNLNMGGPQRVDNEMYLNTTFNLITYRFIEPAPEDHGKKKKKRRR